MKLKHLIQSIQTDVIDAQMKSYRYSEKLLEKQHDSTFPTPFAKGTEIELTLHFAFKSPDKLEQEYETNKQGLYSSLKPQIKEWMNEVLASFEIPKKEKIQNHIEQSIKQSINDFCELLDAHWADVVSVDLDFNTSVFNELLGNSYAVFIENCFYHQMILTRNQCNTLQEEFRNYVSDRTNQVGELIKANSSLKTNLKSDLILDAEKLKELPERSIHTAKLKIKTDDLNIDYYE